MITIDYHPLVGAVVEAWKKQLPRGEVRLSVSETDLRDLVARLTRAIDVLAGSVDLEELASRLRREIDLHDHPGAR